MPRFGRTIKSPPVFLEDYCGAVRDIDDRWDAVRYSGRARIYLRYDPETEKYPFAIFVGNEQVNICEVGAPRTDVWDRRVGTPEAFDETARATLSFTIFELDQDPDQPGMLSRMRDGESLQNVLEYDDEGEIVVRRPGS